MQQCAHYWKVDEVTGPTSMGRCATCGEEREFKNHLRDYNWDDVNYGAWLAAQHGKHENLGVKPY